MNLKGHNLRISQTQYANPGFSRHQRNGGVT